jgi:hypothetical protein
MPEAFRALASAGAIRSRGRVEASAPVWVDGGYLRAAPTFGLSLAFQGGSFDPVGIRMAKYE